MADASLLFLFAAIFGACIAKEKPFLKAHNHLRRSVFPQASDMVEMEWSDKLENSTKSSAQTCTWAVHNGTENRYSGFNDDRGRITMKWYLERGVYTFYSQACGAVCDSYTKVAYSRFVTLGCGLHTCDDDYHGEEIYAYCEYKSESPLWPVTDNLIYEVGRPCSACPKSHPFCKDLLCVKKGGTCELNCKNCGQLVKDKCRCVCKRGYTGSDCSKTIDGQTPEPCPQCNQTKPMCLHGSPNTGCKTCRCHSGYEGRFCDYQSMQLDTGILLILGTYIVISTNTFDDYYPVDQTKWSEMLVEIQTAVVNASKKDCNATLVNGDIIAAEGFPWLGPDGLLRVLLLIKGQCATRRRRRAASKYMVQQDALRIISAANETFSSALWKNYKTKGLEVKVANRSELLFVHTGWYQTGVQKVKASVKGLVLGITGTLIFLLLVIGLILLLVRGYKRNHRNDDRHVDSDVAPRL